MPGIYFFPKERMFGRGLRQQGSASLALLRGFSFFSWRPEVAMAFGAAVVEEVEFWPKITLPTNGRAQKRVGTVVEAATASLAERNSVC